MKSKESAKTDSNWWMSLKGSRDKHLLSFSMFCLFCLLASKFLATKYLQGLLVFLDGCKLSGDSTIGDG